MRVQSRGWLALCLVMWCSGADPGQGEAAASAMAAAASDTLHPWRRPGDKVDSILPMPEYLRRFRQGLPEPERLSDGAASRDELARRFLAALRARDTAALVALTINRAEFAWLLFPAHLYASPPYELDPEVFWMQLTAGNARGVRRTLDRLGGRQLSLQSLSCRRDTLQVRSRQIKVWSSCGVRYRDGDRVATRRLFGSIVERDGRAKLLSLANDF